MTCDYCGVKLTLGNNGGFAPNGLPLYVCKNCYQKLKTKPKDKIIRVQQKMRRKSKCI